MLEAVIFDMDGLMLDTEPIWTKAHGPAAVKCGVELAPGLPDAIRGTSKDSAERVIHSFYGDDFDAKHYMDVLWAEADKLFEQGIDKMPGLDELLARLDALGVPMAVASGSTRKQIDHHLRACGLERYFSVRVSGFDVEHAKPAPDVFLKAAGELGAEPARTMVLEDSPAGIEAAHAGGFIPVMVPNMVQPTDEVRSLCFAVCDSLYDVIPLVG